MNEYMLRDEIERLKVENGHLKQKLKDAEGYADFKRDFAKFKQDFKSLKWAHLRHWRWWLQIGPLAAAVFIFSFYPELFGSRDQQAKWLFGDDGTITMNATAFFTAMLLPLCSLAGFMGFHRYRQWRKSRGEL